MKKPNAWKFWPGAARRLLARAEATNASMIEKLYARLDEQDKRVAAAETRIVDLCGARDWASRTIHSISEADHNFRRNQASQEGQLRELRARLDLLELKRK